MTISHKRNGYYIVRCSTDRPELPVVCVADVHMGHKNYNQAVLMRVIEYIKSTGAAWFGGGDLIECSNKSSVGAGWAEQTMTPDDQIVEIINLLKPINETCLGLVNGNHEDRAFRDTGINPTQIIARELCVPAAGDELFAIFSLENAQHGKAYTLYACHTKTTNKNSGLAFNFMEREMGGWINTNIICKAHGHDKGLSPERIKIEINCNNMAVRENRTRFWLVGHYIDRPDSYIAKQAKAPKPIGTTAIVLDMDPNGPYKISQEDIE